LESSERVEKEERRETMRWNFYLISVYAAVSEENYLPPHCVNESISIWAEGRLIEGELVPIHDGIDRFIYTTIVAWDNYSTMHDYFCWKGKYLYEIFGATRRQAIDAIKQRKGEFLAYEIEGTTIVVYSWGKEWYLVAPLIKEE